MSTSDKTFTQVKDILRKLDRSIDEAREKRLSNDHHPSGTAASPRASASDRLEGQNPAPPPARGEATRSGAGSWIAR